MTTHVTPISGPRSAVTGAKTLDIAERRRDVARMRRTGMTLDAIAAEVGVSKTTVVADVKAIRAALSDIAVADLDAWRSAKLAEHQHLRDQLWASMAVEEQGATVAKLAAQLIALDRRDSELLGVDAPLRVATANVQQPMSEAQAAEILAEFGIETDASIR